MLLGLHTRGVPGPPDRRASIQSVEFLTVAVDDVTMYRDDLRKTAHAHARDRDTGPGGIDDKIVVLVNDVLFSSRASAPRFNVADLAGPARYAGRSAWTTVTASCRSAPEPRQQTSPSAQYKTGQRPAGRVRRPQRGNDLREAHLLSINNVSPAPGSRRSSDPPPTCTCRGARSRKTAALRGRTVMDTSSENSTRTRWSFRDHRQVTLPPTSSTSPPRLVRLQGRVAARRGIDVLRHGRKTARRSGTRLGRRCRQILEWVRHRGPWIPVTACTDAARLCSTPTPCSAACGCRSTASTSRSSGPDAAARISAPTCCPDQGLGAHVTVVAPPSL